MEKPLQITFRDLEHSEVIEAKIEAKVQELERLASPLMSCHVTVQGPPGHKHKGGSYTVHVDVRVPNGEIVVSRDHELDHSHEDVYVAIRDAFNAVARRLEDYQRRQRGQVKQHEGPVHGTISKLFRDDGYGFVLLPDGTDVYFHENSVVDAVFPNLHVGAEVRLVLAEGEGERGPQASTVTPIGKHHPAASAAD